MIPKKVEKEFNNQINEELYSAYLYLAMSADFASKSLSGFAQWMYIQSLEEMIHAQKFFNHIIERGGEVELQRIEKPQKTWTSPLVAFQEAYKHEQHITGRINGLVDLAVKEKDHASNSMLQWFVDEQVEEEATADDIVQKLKLIAKAPEALYMLDKEMGTRVFTPPVAGGE
ncbi:MAG: ferritin [Candidatus Altiarchaeota archaeon]